MVYCAGKLIEATVTATATATATKTAKSNRFRLAKQQFCTCITLFCTFLCRRCTPKAKVVFTFYGGREHKTTILFFFS